MDGNDATLGLLLLAIALLAMGVILFIGINALKERKDDEE
jgi:hypothetical protein